MLYIFMYIWTLTQERDSLIMCKQSNSAYIISIASDSPGNLQDVLDFQLDFHWLPVRY